MLSDFSSKSRRVAGLVVAMLAFLAAVAAAVGPARSETTEFRWPPRNLPASTPSRGWYTPLPLLHRVAGRIEVLIPCELSPPLRATDAVTVLATARRPEKTFGLRVVARGARVYVELGTDRVASAPWPEACPLRIRVTNGVLEMAREAVQLRAPTLDAMPIVTGLFTELDLRTGSVPRVAVETRRISTTQTARQIVAALVAVALGLVALFLVIDGRRARPSSFGRRVKAAARSFEAVDAFVLVVLVGWWILAPPFTDDSWISVEHRSFASVGENSFYYDVWGVNLPIGYWFEWVIGWFGGATTHLVFMRLPALAALVLTWLFARWALFSALGRPSHLARWTLAGAFLLGAVAWGMTLRLEPAIALFTVVNLVAMLSFVTAPRLAPLVVVVVATTLAVNAHPVGVLAVAPLIAGSHEIVAWIRRGHLTALASLLAVALAGGAFMLVLYTLDADLASRLEDARISRTATYHSEPWWREFVRYANFDSNGGETAARRLSLALLAIVAGAWLLRPRGDRLRADSLPARATAVGLVLLAFVPSKWPWHFGALIALGAVAAGIEIAHRTRENLGRPVTASRCLVAVAVVAATFWAVDAAGPWAPLDLQRLDWTDAFGTTGTRVLALGLLLGIPLVVLRALGSRFAPWVLRLPSPAWLAVAVPLAVVAGTIALLAADATKTPWSPARQNLDALAGRSSCGLAEHLQSDVDVVRLLEDPTRTALVAPPVGVYVACGRIPSIRGGVVQIPDLVVFETEPWPLDELDGPFAATRDLYGLRTVIDGPAGIRAFLVDDRIPGYARLELGGVREF